MGGDTWGPLLHTLPARGSGQPASGSILVGLTGWCLRPLPGHSCPHRMGSTWGLMSTELRGVITSPGWWSSCWCFSPAHPGPSGWQPYPVSTGPPNLGSSVSLTRRRSVASSRWWTKTPNRTDPRSDPCRMCILTSLLVERILLTATLSAWDFYLIFIWLPTHPDRDILTWTPEH